MHPIFGAKASDATSEKVEVEVPAVAEEKQSGRRKIAHKAAAKSKLFNDKKTVMP